MLAGGLGRLDPDQVEGLVLGLREDVVALKRETAIFMPLRGLLSGVEKIGPTLDVAPQLLEMADAGTAAAVYLVQGLKPGLEVMNTPAAGGSSIPQLVTVIHEARPQLLQASVALDRVAAARDQIATTENLPWRVQELLRLFDENLPLAEDGLRVLQILPTIMGTDGPRTYLIVAQNEDELRATGGFISGVGILAVNNGQIGDLSFTDAYEVDDWANKPYDFPPAPYYTFMGLELFLFRDSNFWPDFPTSAESMMNLYTYGRGTVVDGIIAVDQQFVAMVVGAVGPVPLEQYNLTVTGENAVESMRRAWEGTPDQTVGEWIYTRKEFIGQLAAALRNKLENQPGDINWPVFIRAMFAAVNEKHLQIYMRDPVVAAVLDEVNFDGRVENRIGQDLLMVVDTNMGYNKASTLMATSLTYQVTLNTEGSGTADLGIHYQHLGQGGEPPICEQGVGGYTTETTYEQLIRRCYWSYMRVYAPPNSVLVAASTHPVPAEAFGHRQEWNGTATTSTDNTGLTLMDNFVLIPFGQTADVLFQYSLPKSILRLEADGSQTYRLRIVKQAGIRAQPVVVIISLPENYTLVSAYPSPSLTNNEQISFDLQLTTDVELWVNFR